MVFAAVDEVELTPPLPLVSENSWRMWGGFAFCNGGISTRFGAKDKHFLLYLCTVLILNDASLILVCPRTTQSVTELSQALTRLADT